MRDQRVTEKRTRVWLAAVVALVMSSGAGDAWAARVVHIESDDILDVTGGTIEPQWAVDPPPSDGEDEEEGEADTGDYKCASPSNSKGNSGLGNNCSWCVNSTGTAMLSCKCDGDNKNHNTCDITIEAGSKEFEVWNDEYTELIVEVLKDNGIDPPEGFGEDGAAGEDGEGAASADSPNAVEIGSGRRL